MLTKNDFVGRNIGGYDITALIASSASSTVLLGERKHPDHRFAVIKWLHSTHIASFEGQEGFFHEVRRVRRLQHAFIVPNLGAGIENSTPYLISEFASNGSLRQGMQARSPWLQLIDNAIIIIAQAGQALYYAHQHNIVHGNLKPENILLNGRGKVWLTDFHLSSLNTYTTRLLAAPTSTTQKERFSTEAHVEDTAIVSKENDIYALASIAYELLTGRKPYMTPSVNNPGHQYKLKALIPPRRHNGAIPLHVEQTLLRALSKDPAPRYTDVMDFLGDLGSPLDLDDSVIDMPASTLKIVVVSAQTAQAEPVPVGESAPMVAVAPPDTVQEAVAATAFAAPFNPVPATFSSPAWAFSPETPMSDVTSLPTSSMTPVAPVFDDVSTPAASFSSVTRVADTASTPASLSTPALSSLDTVPMPAASTLPPVASDAVNADPPGEGLTFISPSPVFSDPGGSGTAFASYNPAAYEQAYQAGPAFSSYTPVPERPVQSGLKLSNRKLIVLLLLICLVVFVSVGGAWAFTSSLQPVQQGNSQLQTPEQTQGGSLPSVATQTATLTETPTQEPSPTPTATPTLGVTPTPQSTPTPKPTEKPTPTPTSAVPKGLSVSPTRLSKSNCSNSRGDYVCVVEISLGGKSGGDVTWLAYGSGVRASVRPSVGTISPGETVKVTITISDSCNTSGSIRFITTKDDLSVSWKC